MLGEMGLCLKHICSRLGALSKATVRSVRTGREGRIQNREGKRENKRENKNEMGKLECVLVCML